MDTKGTSWIVWVTEIAKYYAFDWTIVIWMMGENYDTSNIWNSRYARLEIGSYDDKNGNKVYTADVVVDQFDFLNSKSESTQRPATTQQTNIDPFANNGQQIDISDDNIPF